MKRAAALILALSLAGAACGSDPPLPAGAPDGELDCPPETGGEPVVVNRDRDSDPEGARTPFEAMVAEANALISRYGTNDYGIHVIDARTGTIVTGGAEVARLSVVELPTETFAVGKIERCPDFAARGAPGF